MTRDEDRLLQGLAAAGRRSGQLVAAGQEREADGLGPLGEPLGEEFRRSTVERLAGLFEAQAEVVPLRPRKPRRAVWAGSVAAAVAMAAAALWLVLGVPRTVFEPLPVYDLELVSGVAAVRGEAPETTLPRLVPGSRFALVVRPLTAVEGPLEAKVFALVEGGAAVALEVRAQVAKGGAVRFEGVVGEELKLPSGVTALGIAVGRPGTLPTAAEFPTAAAAKATNARDDVALLIQPVAPR